VYFSLKDSNITRPQDFVNKTVGMKPGTGTDYSYIAMLDILNIDRSLIKEVEVGYDLAPLYSGEVDVWPGFRINEPRLAIEQGYEVNMIYPEDWGVTIYSDVLFTTEENIVNNPKQVRDFTVATLKGWEYTLMKPEEALDIIMKYAPQSSREHQLYMLEKSLPLIHTGDSKLGEMNDEEWTQVIDTLISANVLDSRINPEELYVKINEDSQ
jgi:ABC-type nitrate/sulfonate/bicarbonate transport system substrate-binding protein